MFLSFKVKIAKIYRLKSKNSMKRGDMRNII